MQHYICQELLGMQGWGNNLWVVLTFSSPGQVPCFRVTGHLATAPVFWADQSVLISEDLPFSRYQKSPFCQPEPQVISVSQTLHAEGTGQHRCAAMLKATKDICETKISRSSLKFGGETYLFFTTMTSSVYRDALLCLGIWGCMVCFTINCNFLIFIVFCYRFPSYRLIAWTDLLYIFIIHFTSFPITPSQLSSHWSRPRHHEDPPWGHQPPCRSWAPVSAFTILHPVMEVCNQGFAFFSKNPFQPSSNKYLTFLPLLSSSAHRIAESPQADGQSQVLSHLFFFPCPSRVADVFGHV